MKQIRLSSMTYLISAVAAIAALLLGGCGGSEGSEISVETGSLTKAQFIEKAEAICDEGDERFQDELSDFLRRNSDLGSSRSEREATAEELVDTIYLPIQEEQIDRITALGAPSGDQEEIAAILEAFREGLEEAESHPLRFVRAASVTYLPFDRATKLAEAYGFTVCGRG